MARRSMNMLKKSISFFTIISSAIIFFSLPTVATPAAGNAGMGSSVNDFTAGLDSRIPQLMSDFDIPGVTIALVKNGRIAWSAAYGYADVEKDRKMTIHTWCRVESISKSVTTWGVMKLVEDGRVDLDSPVVNYITSWEFPPSEYDIEKVTLRQLLSNSSGMPLGTIGERYDPTGEVPMLRDRLSKDAVLMQEPGKGFSYSNTGFNILELMIEEVTGRDFAEYMKNEILLPLGMERSSFTWNDSFDPAVPNGYDLNGNPIPVYIYPDRASGGLFASVEDIAAFITAGMKVDGTQGKGVLRAGSVETMYTPVVDIQGYMAMAFDSYGLGHLVEFFPEGEKAVSHGGQGSGWMTFFHSVPETGDGIVIFCNSQRSWPFFGYILSDWAKWCGFSSVGMGNIITGRKGVLACISLLLVVLLWQLWRIGRGLVSGVRRFAPFAGESRVVRGIELGVSVLLALVLVWIASLKYFFLTSIFPILASWLGVMVVFSAVVLFLSVLFPLRGNINDFE